MVQRGETHNPDDVNLLTLGRGGVFSGLLP